ncbi:sulfide:quinone oxidoreductase, mitochondrial [Contarinia nasturtii]|uniref:sulfide:quinone oxidoreductase, mitochondrial n=1 Tax=Contarinia nasturtii TaxID=265458 RepID=UPI0012D40F1D|nr:sulfide:quinone oxidoreductase, mitochondrial [Contarinia nasturtii]
MNKFRSLNIRKIQFSSDLHSIRLFSATSASYDKFKCKALVVGGGTAGCSIAAKLASVFGKNECIILEPANDHYYQPMFTMIGGGMKTLSQVRRSMASVLPKKAKWIQDAAVRFDPDDNEVITKQGHIISYELLIIAVGLQLCYGKIPGLEEALSIPNGNVTSIYSPKYVDRHLNALNRFENGNIIFTFPASPVKCPGAPQKICYITEHFLRKTKKREQAHIMYNSSLPTIFGCKAYADALWKVANGRSIEVNLKTNLIEVHGDKNVAVFASMDNPNEKKSIEYSILHAVPPQSPPQVLLESKHLTNEAGFVDVDKATMQHVKYPNVFALGDCASSPNSKTMAAIAGQVGVLNKNIESFLKGKPLRSEYDGYASCPLVTGYDSCILAEFDYNLQPKETFPFRQDVERYSMFLMKRDFMPFLYWHLMLNGWWNGPASFRKLFSLFKRN